MFQFKIGSFDCAILPDVVRQMDAGILFSNAPPDELQAILSRYNSDGTLLNIFGCLLVQTGNEIVLIDAGMGDAFPETGQLFTQLAQLNISPAHIDTLILTHCHPDHIAGMVTKDGTLAFPNAGIVLWHSEWAFWTDEAELATQPAGRADAVRRYLPPVANKVELMTDASEPIRPGIYPVPTPGHSPGHMGVRIQSGEETLLFAGDAFLHPIHIEQPDWVAQFDMNPAQVPATRRQLIEQCIENDWWVTGYHFAPAGIGRIEKSGKSAKWQPSVRKS